MVELPSRTPSQASVPSLPILKQPTSTLDMSISSERSDSDDSASDANNERRWSNGICSVSGNCKTLCLACCCPCIVYGHNQRRFHHLRRHGTSDLESSASCGGRACWIHCLLTSFIGCGWILQIPFRRRVRRRYSIRGSLLGDCCASFWCNPCALTQEALELGLEEQGALAAVRRPNLA
ncbi:PLAC8-domain-containing protein [Schizophyllum commune H4-8]|uniref:PLAC8-domain-containing protein n=1 Tax=Schizophyllum commune (strain H4-8 / FGSC 9210) TaxID=578458 RepID=UPI00215E9DF9|nr:PLAC8-domain-containing protein [Schizophyllum commune H4-8]KAI5888267.1 PLAC8-domain-containing protein [Schizophyllum commune H4-8]